MKKISVLILPVLLAAIFSSCSSSDTPRAVADKFLKSMSTQDFETAKKFGTEETEKLLDMMNGFAKMSPDSAKKEIKFEIVNEKVNGDNAIIYYKEEDKEGELQLPMVKIDGKWKVLLSKESINNSDESNLMDMGATNTDTLSH